MMLLSCIEGNKYDFLVLETSTNKGIFFDENIVPDLLYDLSILPILLQIKATYENKTNVDTERIIIRDRMITNYVERITIAYKLDKAQKKKAIIVSSSIASVITAVLIVGVDLWISSKR